MVVLCCFTPELLFVLTLAMISDRKPAIIYITLYQINGTKILYFVDDLLCRYIYRKYAEHFLQESVVNQAHVGLASPETLLVIVKTLTNV